MILALAGGVGGAKLATGLARVLPDDSLTVIVNTGDDFEHLGLHISPDLDTVMYNLAGRHNPETGWGVAGETWRFMQALRDLGGEDWFLLGDSDLATHVERTRRLRAGESLSAITHAFCAASGIRQRVAPMSDDAVRTIVLTDQGRLAFQDYFVRLRCAPAVRHIEYAGAASAGMSPEFRAALGNPLLRAIVICPSNPFLSVAPILALPEVSEMLRAAGVPIMAVSPIVGGKAIKGPAAKLFQELGWTPSAAAVARHYQGVIDTLILDVVDAPLAVEIEALGIRPVVCDTVMHTEADKDRLARDIVALLTH